MDRLIDMNTIQLRQIIQEEVSKALSAVPVPVTNVPQEEEILTIEGVAKLLQCSKQHVVNLTNRGKIQSFNLGKSRRWRRSEILKSLDNVKGRSYEKKST